MKVTSYIILLGFVLWPLYVAYFVVASYRAWKQKSDKKPPIIELIAFTMWFLLALAVAIPNFTKHNPKSPQSEAKTNLGAIYVAQLAYFSNANTYAAGPKAFELMEWKPAGQNRYAYYCQGAMIPNKLPMRVDYIPKPDGRWPITAKPQSSKSGFTCMAVGNIDNDSDLDVWSINDAKIMRNENSDI